MLPGMSVVAGFFSLDRERVQQALVASDASNGEVTSLETMHPTANGMAYAPGGVLDEAIFGGGAFGHVAVSGLVHPLAFRLARGPVYATELRAVALGKLAIRGRGTVAPEMNNPRGDLLGPEGVESHLRAMDPAQPALAFCGLARVPVLPRAERPLVRGSAPTMFDPWIGPVNERYVELVHRAARHARLRTMNAPQIISDNEQIMVQAALLALFDELVPPRLATALDEVPIELAHDESALGLAWASDDALVVQRHDQVLVLGVDGVTRTRAPASPCRLRGVVGRHAIFHGFFDATWDVDRLEASVLDLETGAYLTHPPPTMPAAFVAEGDHEDLSLQSLGDGPTWKPLRHAGGGARLLAYTNDLRFAWVGDPAAGTAIVELATGIPHAMPVPIGPDAAGTAAVVFAGGSWHVLWPNGTLADLRGAADASVPVPARAAAFSPDGASLGVLEPTGESIILVDRTTGEVRSRLRVPH